MKRRDLWKKVIAVGLSSVIAAGMLSGCGAKKTEMKGQTGAEQGETTGEETESTETASGDIPTLVWWTVAGTIPSDFQQNMDTINEYLADKLHIKLNIKTTGYGDYEQKVNTLVNAGENFDILFVNNTNYSRFVNLGAFENISDSVRTVTPDLYKLIPEQLWSAVKIGGNIYGVPTYKDSSLTQFWYFDDTYVKKYNIDTTKIKTMEDLDGPFRAMKAGEGKNFYPLELSQGSLFSGFYNDYDDLALGFAPVGVRIDDASRKVVCTLEQDDIMKNLKQLHQWYKDGIINPDANVVLEAPKKLPFSNAQGWPSAVTTWQTLNGVEKYDAFKVFGPLYSTAIIQGSINAISKNSKYKDEALKLLQLINTDQKFRDMLAYGVEGKTFEYVSSGVVKKLTDSWPLAAYTQGTFFDMSITDDTDPAQWNEVKAQNESAASSSCLGFVLDISNIQNEVTNCNTVYYKYKFDMLTGASDPETAVPKCIAELKAAGLDTIISEAQKQIDEFYN